MDSLVPLSDDPEKIVSHADFYDENLVANPVQMSDTLFDSLDTNKPGAYSMFDNQANANANETRMVVYQGR